MKHRVQGSRILLNAYSLLWRLLSPLLCVYLLYRSIRQANYRQHWLERFGFDLPAFKEQSTPVIWIHAVSLGETRALASLLPAIAKRYPSCRLLLTHGTPTGRQAGKELLLGMTGAFAETQQCYLPYDNRDWVDRFLEHYRPAIGMIIETEVWPMLLDRAKALGVLMLLVSARLSEKSLVKARRTRLLIEPALASFHRILCQSDRDRQRILQVAPTAECQVCGNLKFDVQLSEAMIQQGLAWRHHHQDPAEISADQPRDRWIIAASTREGEEALLLEQWRALPNERRKGIVFAIVPRHPQRFEAIAQLLELNDPGTWMRRSDHGFPRMTRSIEIVLGDSLGEMAAWYALCDVVVMGGSLINTGSQNFIEACAAGKPVILGPSIYNFEQAAKEAIASGAAIQVDASKVLETACELIEQSGSCQSMGEHAKKFVAAHQGATLRVMAVVDAALEEKSLS